MNKELEKTLQTILDKSIEVAEKTGEFVVEQAPLLLQEFYKWHIASAMLGILLGTFFAVCTYKGFKRLMFLEEKNSYADYDVFAYVLATIGGITSIVIFCVNTYDLIFILVAPKLYLIEYFMKD